MTSIAPTLDSVADGGIAELVGRLRAGEERAFVEIIEAFSPSMTQICFVVCGNDDLADEAVAAAWPIVWRRITSLREPRLLRTWLIAIAANEARQLMRARRRRAVREIAIDDRDDGPTAQWAEDRFANPDLESALARLSPDDRRLLALRYVAGFDSNELATATGLSAPGVRARLARLLKRLRLELSDD